MTPVPVRQIAVLVSGRGSNLQALIDASAAGQLGSGSIAIVLSNVEGAFALERARGANIPTCVIDHRGWPTRDDFDRAVVQELQRRDVDLVCLAGFMRKLGRPLLHAYPDAILNIHPSLLPSFPGLHPQRQALAHGVKVSGVTVHLVTDDLGCRTHRPAAHRPRPRRRHRRDARRSHPPRRAPRRTPRPFG